MYTYRKLLEALQELSPEDLDKPVVIMSNCETPAKSQALFVEGTDSFDKYGSTDPLIITKWQSKLPYGQPYLISDRVIRRMEDFE